MHHLLINDLRIFAFAAHHLHLCAAAEKLSVTPPAVSHQIRGVAAALSVIFVPARK